MKYKKFIPLLILSLLLTSCSQYNSIKKNTLIEESFDTSNSYSNKSNGGKLLSEEEAKLKALEILENFLNVKLYLTEVSCHISFTPPSSLKNILSVITQDKDINEIYKFENSNSILDNGMYSVSFTPKDNQGSIDFNIDINAITGELIEFSEYYPVVFTNKSIKLDALEKSAKDFVENYSIGGIKTASLIDSSTKYLQSQNICTYTFEDSTSRNKIVKISVDATSQNIVSIAIGLSTLFFKR